MDTPTRFQLRWDKLKAAVAYLTERSLRDENFGQVKLVKLLYYADCAAYLRTGQPLTGSNYVRQEHGPYPEDWRSITERLEREGVMRIHPEDIPGGYRRRRPVPAGMSSGYLLTEQERTFLDDQLRRFAEFNAAQIEEYSHDEVAWRTTEPGRVIPWELAGFRMPGPPDEETKARGRRIADRIRRNGRQVSRILVERQDAV